MKIYIKLKITFNINNNNTDYKQNMNWIIKKQKKIHEVFITYLVVKHNKCTFTPCFLCSYISFPHPILFRCEVQ